jgi:hypothetical protein
LKKKVLTAAFISVLLLIAVTDCCFVKLAQANPYSRYDSKHVPAPADATPLVVSVSSPKNHATYGVNDVAVAFSVSIEDITKYHSSIYDVYFKASWLQDNVTLCKQKSEFWSYNETFWNLPDGEYYVVITACGGGSYADNTPVGDFWGMVYSYDMTTISVVNFTIATPPEASILSPKNETYGSSEVPLNVTVDKSFSKISYVLDCQNNMTISGNATLTGLSNGVHNVTVYAWDATGNIGSSETVNFTVAKVTESQPEPFSTSVIAASVAAVIVGALLVYFKKRRREAEQA